MRKILILFVVATMCSCARERWQVIGTDQNGRDAEWLFGVEPGLCDTIYFKLKWTGDFEPVQYPTQYYVTDLLITKIR